MVSCGADKSVIFRQAALVSTWCQCQDIVSVSVSVTVPASLISTEYDTAVNILKYQI